MKVARSRSACLPCPVAEEQQSTVQTVHAAGREAAAKWYSALMCTSVEGVLAKGIADIPCPHKRNHRIINNKAVRTGLW